jgi:hypothetical protein
LPNELSSTIVAVKSASERGRAESIRDVVDAYRRLYGSVQRFVLMLTDEQWNFASVGTSGSHSLNQLLSVLAEQAKAAAFVRLRDLKATIEEARCAEQLRDAIFSATQGGRRTRTARCGLRGPVRRACARPARMGGGRTGSGSRQTRRSPRHDRRHRGPTQVAHRRTRPRPLERLNRDCHR